MKHIFCGPSFQSSAMVARGIFRVAVKREHGASSCMWGCIKAPLGSSVVPKAFLWGHFWMGEWGLKRFVCGPSSQSSAMLARVIYKVALKERTRRVQLHVGLRKGSPGEFRCTQSLPLGALLDGRKVLKRVVFGPIFQSSPMPARAMFRDARKQRTRRVQLHVGLRKGSPGEFTCTQSLPLVTLLDGRKGLATHFMGPDFSVVSDAG